MAFDHFIKEFFRDIFVSAHVDTDLKVGSLPLQIDCIIEIPDHFDKSFTPLPFPVISDNFRKINLFEFKSYHDTPKFTDLSKLMGYLGLWCAKKQISITNIDDTYTIWYLSAKRPNFIDSLMSDKKIEQLDISGFYRMMISFPCSYYILIIEELPCTIETAPLHLLGNPNMLKEALKLIELYNLLPSTFLDKFLTLIYLYYYDDVKAMTEIEHILPAKIKTNIKHALEDIGLETVVEAIGFEKLVNAYGVDKLVDAFGLEKLVKTYGLEKLVNAFGLEKILNSIDPDELDRILKKIRKNPTKKK